jgi:hypothetical protein
MAERAVTKKSRRACNKKRPILHTGRRVTLPLVRSKQPGTVALDNANIFEIIPFP